MMTTGFKDIFGRELCVSMKCEDQINHVDDIEIIEEDGKFFAKPSGLDAEPLEGVYKGLVITSC
ncbi:hypothetical protein ACFYU8_17755 [Brevibacillus sp. NPDC003359]|uniref:hypothetical protein n=1 Tax=unclassified Brevibacillus TaxID=2684853 RepID=UPI0036A5BDCD